MVGERWSLVEDCLLRIVPTGLFKELEAKLLSLSLYLYLYLYVSLYLSRSSRSCLAK